MPLVWRLLVLQISTHISRQKYSQAAADKANYLYNGALVLGGSTVWMGGGSPCTELLNKVKSKAFRLIDSHPLTDCLQPLTLHRNVASLAIFYRHFHDNYSSEFANCMPRPLPVASPHMTFYSLIHILSTHLMQELTSIFTSIGKLWNSLPESVFPPYYNFSSFKRRVSRHLQP